MAVPRDPGTERRWRRSHSLGVYFHYLRKPLANLARLVAFSAVLVAVGGLLFEARYQREPMTFAKGMLATYWLLLGEEVVSLPNDPVLQVFTMLLPLIGLVVVVDGILQFSYHVLRRDEGGREWAEAVTSTLERHVILCGLGNGGMRILQQLLKLDEDVVVLEKNTQCPHLGFARGEGVPIFHGMTLDPGTIESLGVRRAKSIILSTSDDLANLEMAMDARKANPGIRVVLRMYDQELAAKVKDAFGIDVALSRSEISAPLFATCASDSSILNAFYVGSRLLVVARLAVDARGGIAGTSLASLQERFRVHVLSHEREKNSWFWPETSAVLKPGDRFTVQTEPDTLARLHQANRDAA